MTGLDCPRCWEPLEEETRKVFAGGVTIDVCPECSGVYLDEGEIKQLVGDRDLHGLLTSFASHVVESELACPNCDGRMDAQRLDIGNETTVVEVCTDCHGIWLDDGELGKLQATASEHDDLAFTQIWEEDASEDERKHLLGQLLGGLRRQ